MFGPKAVSDFAVLDWLLSRMLCEHLAVMSAVALWAMAEYLRKML